MKCKRVAFLSVLLLLFCALLQTGIMAADSAPAAVDNLSIDSRLTQKVTYEAKSKPVKQIVTDISAQTGVALVAGYNAMDWQVRDRRMNVFAKEMPLSDLMASIARVMKFKWSTNSKIDPPAYRLIQDRKALAKETTEEDQKSREIEARMKENRGDFLDWVMKGEKPDDAKLESMKESDPYRYSFYKRGAFDYFKALFNERPELQKAFLNPQHNMWYKVGDLSKNTQDLLRNALLQTAKLDGPEGEARFLQHADHLVNSSADTEFMPRPNLWRQQNKDWYFGGGGSHIDREWFGVGDTCNPDDPRAKIQAAAEMEYANSGSNGVGVEATIKQKYQDLYDEATKLWEKSGGGEPVVEHADEPALHEKVKLEDCPDRLSDLEEKLAKASKLNIVSDSFKSLRGWAKVAGSETELVKVLGAIAQGYNSNWEKHDSTIEFRNRNAFHYRALQIPDEWVEGWRSRFIKSGQLSLEDYGQIAWLTGEQIEENLLTDELFSTLEWCLTGWWWENNREMLRLYALLTPRQRSLMFTEAGLPAGMLKPNQLEQVAAIGSIVPDQYCAWELPDKGYFKAFWGPKEYDLNRCHIDVFDGDGKSIHSWKIAIAKYDPPKKPEQPETKPGEKPAESTSK